MKSKSLLWATGIIGLLVVAGVTGVIAGTRAPNHFAGVLNDYTSVAGGTGPWEVRGPWTLDVNEKTGKADFSAAVTMELTDFALSGANIGDVWQNAAHSSPDGCGRHRYFNHEWV